MRTDDQQMPIFCLKKAIAQAILGAIGGIVWSFMVIHSSKAVSNYVQMVGISACVFFFFLSQKFFCHHMLQRESIRYLCILCPTEMICIMIWWGACSENEKILIYSLLFQLVVTVVLLNREIRGPFLKVMSGGNTYSAGRSMGWSEYSN